MTKSYKLLLELRHLASLCRASLTADGHRRLASDVDDMHADCTAMLRDLSRPTIDAVAAEVVA